MTIAKAIAILSILMEVKARIGEINQHDAIKLGLEALLAVKSFRTGAATPALWQLLSETKD